MAARQDQGLQIALIILIFLFILSAVAAYIGWKSYSESEQRRAELQGQLDDKNQQVNSYQSENEQLRTWMGYGPNDNIDSVKTAYEGDMKKFGAAIADESRRYYKNVLEAVHKEFTDTAAREAESKQRYKELDERYTALVGETDRKVAEYRDRNKKLDEDYASERNKFNQFVQELEKTKGDLLSNLDKQRTELESQIADREEKIKQYDLQVAELRRAVVNWREQVPKDEESFEIPDGRITWINQTNGTVWINVGEADSVRRQLTFNVYDGDENDPNRAVKKGSIEVTRVAGDHMAEAKITQDDPTNPILTGDHIYSPVWHRGKKLRFALTGIVDFNDDGSSDLQLARELIELNGGAVDAYLGEDGKVVGEITAHTRYLVLGDFPESAIRANMQEGWQSMNQKADELGVETITLDQFINRMGYTPQERVVRLGDTAAAGDFSARLRNPRNLPEAEPQADEDGQFRPRRLPRTGQRTPY